MTNSEALKSLCNAIANTFYPDDSTISLMLFNEGIEPTDEAVAKDERILRLAISLVMGYVEGSRSENGLSTSVKREVTDSIRYWCNLYGIDADELLGESAKIIYDGSNYW